MANEILLGLSLLSLLLLGYTISKFAQNLKIIKENIMWKNITLAFSLALTFFGIYAYYLLKDVDVGRNVVAVLSSFFLAALFALFVITITFNLMDDYKAKKERFLKLNFMVDTHTKKKVDEYQTRTTELRRINERLAMQAEMLDKQQRELKMFNEELKKAHTELEKEKTSVDKKVKERTKQLKEEKNIVENLLTQKTQFINQLSHDLRTPLTPLLNLLPFVKNKLKDKETLKIADICIKNVHYLEKLILNTLSLARVEAKTAKLELSKVSVYDLMDEILEANKMTYKQGNIKVLNNFKRGLKVEIDELKMREVFENIIGNSIKYNDNEEKTIDVSADTIEKNVVEMKFKDNGIGIEAKHLNSIFNEFYKVDPSRHHHESSGLGLSIAKRIIEMHNGQILALSDGAGKGTTITIRIPIGVKKK